MVGKGSRVAVGSRVIVNVGTVVGPAVGWVDCTVGVGNRLVTVARG